MNRRPGRSPGRPASSASQQSSSADGKLCRVCGDGAMNINFSVLTCESCKAFFRRNALMPKELKCTRIDACEITADSRKSCKKCRLRKCFEVGMVKEWIMTDEEKLQKRRLIESNREKRRHVFNTASSPRRKSPKIEILDSFSTTSSSASFDDRPTSACSNKPFATRRRTITTPADRIRSNNDNNKWSGGNNNPEPKAELPAAKNASLDDSDSIMVPKSVLLRMIQTCEQNSRNACSLCAPPPVLIHAWRLYESCSASSPDDHGGEIGADCNTTTSRTSGASPALECVCWCVCGARDTPMSKMGIGNSGGGGNDEKIPFGGGGGGGDESEATSSADLMLRDAISEPRLEDVLAANARIAGGLLLSTTTMANLMNNTRIMTDPNNSDWKAHHAQELTVARRAMDGLATELGYTGSTSTGYPRIIDDASETVRITHGYVSRIIAMCKMLTPFRKLSTSDQMVLLQGGIREQLMVQSVINYSHDIDGWHPFGNNQPAYEMRLDIFYKFRPEQMEPHASFIRSFAAGWSSDEVLMQALSAICLFEPTRQNLNDRETVARQQAFYCDFMREYLLIKYGHQEGLRVYAELQTRLSWLRGCVSQMQPMYHLELSPTDLRPLMFEMIS